MINLLEKIKTLLGIEDDLQDEVLNIIISTTENHLKALLGKDIPSELHFITQEISIRRFNRLGTEGMKSESVEGHKIDFYDLDKDFEPFMSIIEEHSVKDDLSNGKVMFI